MHRMSPSPARVLPVLVLAQLAGTSPWFAVNAVMPDLQAAFGWPASDIGSLSAAVQWGFIAGTLVFALLARPAQWPQRWLPVRARGAVFGPGVARRGFFSRAFIRWA